MWWWRGLCGLSCGTVGKMPLASGGQLVLFFLMAVAVVALHAVVVGVVRLVPRDVLQDAACERRAVCDFCLHDGGGGGAVCRV